FVGQFRSRHVNDDISVVLDDHSAGIGDEADLSPGQIPFIENLLNLLFAPAMNDDQHALLRFAEHDFVGGHVRRALGNFVQFDLDAGAGASGSFASGAGQTGGAHVLDSGDSAGGKQFEASFEHELLHERIADLHGTA